jgi:Mrp family chromosome partitioning ATPase
VIPKTFSALESPRFETLLTKYKQTYDVILCAAPPVLDFTDAVILSSQVDATCLVLTCGVSRLDAAVEARSALATVKANIIGAILTDFGVYSRDSDVKKETG